MIIIWLLLAHYLGDYGFQSEWIAKHKAKFWYIMFIHCFIWSGLVSLVLQLTGNMAPWKFFFLMIGHGIMDTIKWKIAQKKGDPGESHGWTYLDQSWHIIQLLIVWRVQ